MTMKKEGIQTRNRKLSSKGKKKKGGFGIPDGLQFNNSKSFPSFAHPMSSAMSAVNQYRDFMYRDTAAHNMGQFGTHFGLTGSGMHMSQMSGQMGLSSLSLPTSSGLNLGLPNSMVGATA